MDRGLECAYNRQVPARRQAALASGAAPVAREQGSKPFQLSSVQLMFCS